MGLLTPSTVAGARRVAELEATNTKLEESVALAERKCAALSKRLDEETASARQLREQLDTMQAKISAERSASDSNAAARVSAQVQKHEAEVEALRTELRKRETAHEQLRSRLAVLEADKTMAQLDLKHNAQLLAEAVAARDEAFRKVQAAQAALEQERQTHEADVRAATDRLLSANAEIDALHQQLDRALSTVARLEAKPTSPEAADTLVAASDAAPAARRERLAVEALSASAAPRSESGQRDDDATPEQQRRTAIRQRTESHSGESDSLLKQQKTQLEANAQLARQLDAQAAELARTKAELLSSVGERERQIERERVQHECEVKELSARLAAAESAQRTAEAALADAMQRLEQAQKAEAEVRDSLAALTQEHQFLSADCERMRLELAASGEARAGLESRLEELEKTHTLLVVREKRTAQRVRDANEEHAQQLSAAKQEHDADVARIRASAEQQVADLSQRADAALALNAELQASLDTTLAEKAQLERDIELKQVRRARRCAACLRMRSSCPPTPGPHARRPGVR